MTSPLAHSPRPPVAAQSYEDHATATAARARANATSAAEFFAGDRVEFVETVETAALYHDLGKLDAANQAVLARVSSDPLPVAHEDAGVAHLLSLGRSESAVLVAAHHAGLFSQKAEMAKQAKGPFRNAGVCDHVNAHLGAYVSGHAAAGCQTRDDGTPSSQLHRDGFRRRIALSCLVDGDHSDTAAHYGEIRADPVPTRWEERLIALDAYVAGLGSTGPRDALRQRVYEECRAANTVPAMRSCDAAVGSGKTTAVMAHLLRTATARNLRHIIVVLPYVNIIQQSVNIYRRALTLPGERPQDVVAEHHHQADFQDAEIRQLSTLWRTPIIVTTAVQFFETLGASQPSRLRKLHELPGSAVFVDETHAAMPAHLWPQTWRWLETWTRDWGGHIVFASGSLPRFWQLPEFVDPPRPVGDVPDLLSEGLRRDLEAAEAVRIRPLSPNPPKVSGGELLKR